jgi:hypothetical protein
MFRHRDAMTLQPAKNWVANLQAMASELICYLRFIEAHRRGLSRICSVLTCKRTPMRVAFALRQKLPQYGGTL